MTRRVVARHDDRLHARIIGSRALRYDEGADASIDRPPHVRAGSSLAWIGTHLAVVQDDANFLAIVDPVAGGVSAVTLPAGAELRRQFDDSRGNKADKVDLEALASVPQADGSGMLVAFGSGSSSRRESIVLVRTRATPATADVAVRHVPALFAAIRADASFAGSELNIEGAVYTGGKIRLFNRGNGATRADVHAVDATADLDWTELLTYLNGPEGAPSPRLTDVAQFELGSLDRVRLTFTDAALLCTASAAGERKFLYSATAEASPDAIRDGPVAGSAIGIIAEATVGPTALLAAQPTREWAMEVSARWTVLRDGGGAPFAGKVEGIVPHQSDGRRAYVIVDRDAGDWPSELCEIALDGPWFADD